MYNWETDYPDPINTTAYLEHQCYETAIENITGKPVERVIRLTETEKKHLLRQYREKKYSEKALYVLYRFHPDLVEKEVSREFKHAPAEKRLYPCVMMKYHFIKPGQRADQIADLLGEPDFKDHHMWIYDCDRPENGDDKRALFVCFDKNRVTEAEMGYMQSGLEHFCK